jgi:putative phage-type endonuclease
MSLSPDQLERRLAGITATDIAAIIGVHPHRSRVDVWMTKMGLAPPFDGNVRTKWGEILERPLRRDYEETHGVVVHVPGTLEHPDFPWMLATPDGIVYPSNSSTPDRGLELKVHTMRLAHQYGAPGTDEVPDLEICQCTWSMAVTSLARWDLRVFMDGIPADYRIDRDDELIVQLVESAERFRVDYLDTKTPPPPDGTDAYTEFLANRHAADNVAAQLIPVDDEPETRSAIERLREVRDGLTELKSAEAMLEQVLKARIGDAAGLAFRSFGRKKPDAITWKKAKDGKDVDHAAYAAKLRETAALVASAKATDFDRAIAVLNSKLATGDWATATATISAPELRALLIAARSALVDIATDQTQQYTRATTGSRRFTVPQWWNKKERKEK